MNALKDLLASERGLVCLAALVCGTVMFGIGRLTEDGWVTFMQWVIVTYVGGKTLTSGIETITRGKTAATTPAPSEPGSTS